MTNKAVNVALPVELADWLRREAFERRVSQGSIVAKALERLRNGSDVDGPTFDRIR